MSLKNTRLIYGSITKWLHWSVAILVLLQFASVYFKGFFLTENSVLGKAIISNYHKPCGILIAFLGGLWVLWHFVNPRPALAGPMTHIEKKAALVVHGSLLLCVVVMPMSGILMSLSAGDPPVFFSLFAIPQWIEKNKAVASYFFSMHVYVSYALALLIAIHLAAVIKHHFIYKDNILRRILPE